MGVSLGLSKEDWIRALQTGKVHAKPVISQIKGKKVGNIIVCVLRIAHR